MTSIYSYVNAFLQTVVEFRSTKHELITQESINVVESIRVLEADNKQLKINLRTASISKPPFTPTNEKSCVGCLVLEKKTAKIFKQVVQTLKQSNFNRNVALH